MPLEALPGWSVNDSGVYPVTEGAFRVRQVDVHVSTREVPTWDQPIVDSASEGRIDLHCGRIDGVLHFLFRAAAEPGLSAGVELTPSAVIEPGDSATDDAAPGLVLASCRQSEEGGRFLRDTNRYRVVDVGHADPPGDDAWWLTLRDVRALLDGPDWFTNESRSALSLLLPWL